MFTTSLLRRTCAEAIGTYALVTAGCGAIIVDTLSGNLTHVGVALTFGGIVMVMIAATGHLSGAHFNPAVTLAFALTRHFPGRDVPAYMVGQVSGAVLGALTLQALFGTVAQLGATLPIGNVWQAFGLEVLLSAVLMFVIIAVATDTRAEGQHAALAIGGTVALAALWGGTISGASMNPARSLAPAFVAGIWQHQWIYAIAPFMGAALGAFLYEFLRRPLLTQMRETSAE